MIHTIVLAPDSFKESLTAKEACQALEAGLLLSLPEARCVHVPMADGGEGTVHSLVDATGGELRTTTVDGPLGDPVQATWGMLGDGRTAVIEMAEASGLALVARERRDVRRASTRGTGQLLLAALDAGARHIVLGIGGSATNDAGAGLAQALGARLLDGPGNELEPGGAALARLDRIDVAALDPRLGELTLEVACDVTNPLCGPDGASAVYGPQKGADPACVEELDAALAHFARVVQRDLGREVASVPGAGAAGGLGAGLLAFTSAELKRGIEIVVQHSGLPDKVRGASLVITGEGRMDSQTRFGKTPKGVADVAAAAGVPVVAVTGSLGDGADVLYDEGFAAIIPILDRLGSLDEVLADGAANLTRAGRNIGALLALGNPCPAPTSA
ncbi:MULTISPECIES: glycerate kinase [unclassified Luteococcus]|uniref:glycerate kinase n=1 Tax=unclassified Luteococcus TaxID=2639923 RepID=UPI00313C4E4B